MTPVYTLPASRQSLLLDLRWVENGQDKTIGTATGFVVDYEQPFLLTNRHVVRGIHQTTGEYLSDHGVGPTHIDVRHSVGSDPRVFAIKREPLYDAEGLPRWIEHPGLGERADLVALPLTDVEGVALMPHSIALRPHNETALLLPTVDVSVVGYPFGEVGGGGLAIWTRGIVASEPAFPYRDLPLFLVDSRTREGQSGSPVIVQQVAGPVAMRDGSTAMLTSHVELVGIYSGRINDESDIGMVWDLSAIRSLLSAPSA